MAMTRPVAKGQRFLAVADRGMTLQVRRCAGSGEQLPCSAGHHLAELDVRQHRPRRVVSSYLGHHRETVRMSCVDMVLRSTSPEPCLAPSHPEPRPSASSELSAPFEPTLSPRFEHSRGSAHY